MLTSSSFLALNAATGTTTSKNFCTAGYSRIGFLCTRTNHSSGNTVFTVNVGMQDAATDSPTMVGCNLLVSNATNTKSEGIAHVSSLTLSSNTSDVVWLDNTCAVNWVNVAQATTTDGKATAYILVEFDTPA